MSIYAVNGKEPLHVWCPSRDALGYKTTTLNDLIGSNDGTLTGMDAATDWVIDNNNGGNLALDFDGTDDHVSCPPILSAQSSNITIAGWVHLSSVFENGAFVKLGNNTHISGGDGVSIGVGNSTFDSPGNSLLVLYEGERWILSGANIGNGWHHFGLVVNVSGHPLIYLDGKLVYSDSLGVPKPIGSNGTALCSLGGYTGSVSENRYFVGKLDDVRIFNQILDSSDFKYLYNNGFGRGITTASKPNFSVNGKKPVHVWCPSVDDLGVGSSILFDQVGKSHGILTNMAPSTDWVTDTDAGGKRALNFPGADDTITLPNTLAVAGCESIALSYWIYLRSLKVDSRHISQWDDSFSNAAWLITSTNGANARLTLATTPTTGPTNYTIYNTTNDVLSLNNWLHIVGNIDPVNLVYEIWVNGVQASGSFSSTNHRTRIAKASQNPAISGQSDGATFDGKIDDIRIFPVTLSSSDIQYLYNNGYGRGKRTTNKRRLKTLQINHL